MSTYNIGSFQLNIHRMFTKNIIGINTKKKIWVQFNFLKNARQTYKNTCFNSQ